MVFVPSIKALFSLNNSHRCYTIEERLDECVTEIYLNKYKYWQRYIATELRNHGSMGYLYNYENWPVYTPLHRLC